MRGLVLAAGVAVAGALLPTGAEAQQRNCIDTLAGMPEYARLVGAVTRSHMVNELRNMQNVTIFAPNNEAIDKVNPQLVDRLFPRDAAGGGREADPVLAAAAIQAHIVQGRIPAAALAQGVRLTTLAGTPLSFAGPGGSERGAQVTAAEGVTARVTQGDIPCSNGVIHGIDSVLIR
jgi:uncharacterized surface protein with fasciclin (FAS1) repeats